MKIYYTANENDFSLLMQKLEERGIVHAPNKGNPTDVSIHDFNLENTCVRVDKSKKVFHVGAKEYYEAYFSEETIINYKEAADKKMKIYRTETQEEDDSQF